MIYDFSVYGLWCSAYGITTTLSNWLCNTQPLTITLSNWLCNTPPSTVTLSNWRCNAPPCTVTLSNWRCNAPPCTITLSNWRCNAQLCIVTLSLRVATPTTASYHTEWRPTEMLWYVPLKVVWHISLWWVLRLLSDKKGDSSYRRLPTSLGFAIYYLGFKVYCTTTCLGPHKWMTMYTTPQPWPTKP